MDDRAMAATLHATPCGAAFVSADGQIELANRRLQAQLGVPASALEGSVAVETLGGDRHGRVAGAVSAALAGRDATVDVEWLRPSGRRIGVTLRAQAHRGADGDVLGAVVTTEDHRSAEQALRERERELEAVQRVARIGSYRTDLVAGTWTASDGFCRIFGFEPGGVYTMKEFEDLVHPDDHERVMEEFGACLAEQRPFDTEYRCLRRGTGECIHVRSTSHVVYGDDGAPVRLIGIKQDITEGARMREQVVAMQRMEALGRLTGGIAHDFNNILGAIVGFADLGLMRTASDHPAHRCLDQVLRAGERAARLISHLLAYSRRRLVDPEVFVVTGVLDELQEMLQQVIGGAVELRYRSAGGIWPVRIDRSAFEQIVVNLVVNARDAMPDGGRLLVQVDNRALAGSGSGAFSLPIGAGDYVCVSVTDTGTGIDAETRQHIFEPFFTTKDVGQGTGLGLATCIGLASQAGGTMSVYSEVGVGSTFRLFLPREHSAPRQPEWVEEVSETGGVERVLVVEDEPQVRSFVVETLRGAGYTVVEAADGLEAIALADARGDEIDLVVSDIIMPRAGAGDLVAHLAETRPSLPVLLMSGFPAEALVDERLLTGALFVLEKPFRPATLLAHVRRVLPAER